MLSGELLPVFCRDAFIGLAEVLFSYTLATEDTIEALLFHRATLTSVIGDEQEEFGTEDIRQVIDVPAALMQRIP
ncbi:hypothetical protein BGX29_002826 [Mortierella sp. GBA35]|nr:hypothetical protein BGX29_002826 [Mortierella sp. GBA35]